MIKNVTLRLAVKEAGRFIENAKALQYARAQPKTTYAYDGGIAVYDPPETPQHSATKRASMDLTRVLASLRASK